MAEWRWGQIFEDDFSVAVSPLHPRAWDSAARSLAPLALTAPGARLSAALSSALAVLASALGWSEAEVAERTAANARAAFDPEGWP